MCVLFFKMDNVRNLFDVVEITNKDDLSLLPVLQQALLIRNNFRCKVRGCRRYCTLRNRLNSVLGNVLNIF